MLDFLCRVESKFVKLRAGVLFHLSLDRKNYGAGLDLCSLAQSESTF